jgi:hypothetical protein
MAGAAFKFVRQRSALLNQPTIEKHPAGVTPSPSRRLMPIPLLPTAHSTTVEPIRINPLGCFSERNGSCSTNSMVIFRTVIAPRFSIEF